MGTVAPHRANELNRPGALLFVLHASPFLDQIGGTEHHVLDLVRGIALPRAVLAYPAGGVLAAAEVRSGVVRRPRFWAFPWPRAVALDVPREQAAHVLIGAAALLGVRAVHVHHLLGFPIDLGPALASAGLPYVFTSHDFHVACPNFHRFDFAAREPCACHAASDAQRRACLAAFARTTGVDIPGDPLAFATRHRAAFQATLTSARAVIFPSGFARATVARAVPLDGIRTVVIEHGYDAVAAAARPVRPGPRLRVAVVGRVSNPLKGPERYAALVALTRGAPIEWHFFGSGAAEPISKLMRGARVVFHGPYRREALPAALVHAGIELCAVLPAAEETFSYVLSEALVAGIPALVSDRGALAERVIRDRVGFVVTTVSEAAEILCDVARDRTRLAAATARARAYRHPTVSDNARRYKELYFDLGWLPIDPAPRLDRAARAELAARAVPADPALSPPAPGIGMRVVRALRPVIPHTLWDTGRALLRR